MKKILYAAAVVVLTLSLSGCYEKFENPDPPVRYDDTYFETEGYLIKTIQEVKALFSDQNNMLNRLPITDVEKQNPPTASGGDPQSTALYSFYYSITEKIVIKGKIVSNDAYGNFYRGLFVQDDTGGIEVKVGETGMYTKFRPGETVYIVCDGLVLGNYRSMLSLGLKPRSEDISDNGTSPYPNRFMELPVIIDKHVKRADPVTTFSQSDTTVIAATRDLTAAELYNLCGKLVRFEELTSVWESYTDSYNAGYPEVFWKFKFNTYGTFNFVDLIAEWKKYRADLLAYQNGETTIKPDMPSYTHTNGKFVKPEPENLYLSGNAKDQPSWGFKQHHWDEGMQQNSDLNLDLEQDNYASAKFENDNFKLGEDSYRKKTAILVRTSGYSRFALSPVVANGRKVAITGIVQRYTDGRGNNIAFQVAVNTDLDIVTLD